MTYTHQLLKFIYILLAGHYSSPNIKTKIQILIILTFLIKFVLHWQPMVTWQKISFDDEWLGNNIRHSSMYIIYIIYITLHIDCLVKYLKFVHALYVQFYGLVLVVQQISPIYHLTCNASF